MLPVAFTCPLWWVARWATRVLTSLAVVAALALGAGPATAAVPTSPVPTSSAVPASVAVGPLPASCRHAEAQAVACSAPAIPPEAADDSVPTWSVDAPVTLPGDQGTIADVVLPVRAAESDRLPRVDRASGRASRAPPRR
ncbi:hypothetical protein [Micromonospora sp. NPDC005220]|uniref:hypothetical protein n=1 Tax=Micromonospora sp. NPDC005220 TaxID=3155589 RepID=UPI0033BE1F5F